MLNKRFWLISAVLWTIAIVVLCLISFNDFPEVNVSNFDKYVHAAFHFTFTSLWYMYLRVEDRKAGNAQILFKIVAASLLLGVALEIAQSFTKTRSADAKDVLANLSGAVVAALLLFAFQKWINRR